VIFYLNSLCSPHQPSRGISQVVFYLPIFFAHWIKSLILPFSGNVYHPWPLPQNLKILFFYSLLPCAGFIALLFIAYKKKIITIKSSFLFLSGILLFLPAVSVLLRYNEFFTANRYAYLPMGAFAIFAVCVIHRKNDEKMSRNIIIFLSAYILVLATASQLFLGKWKDGVTLMRDEIEKFPFDANVAYYLGVAYQENGNMDDAVLSYTKCVELNPLHHQARINLGGIYFKQKFYKEAALNFEKALAVPGPHTPYIFANLGETYLHLGMVDEALKSFNNALASKGDFHYAARRIYEILSAFGRKDEAAKFAESAAKRGLKIDAKSGTNEAKLEYIK
jgi:tetratricopeptide (TPR) repeat protein